MSITNDLRIQWRGHYRNVLLLVVINAGVFVIANLLINVLRISLNSSAARVISDVLCLPGELHDFLPRFWTLFTYMFVHFGLLHVLSNMLWLWFMGRMFVDHLGGKRLMQVYIYGGLAGGILYIISALIFPGLGFGYLLGASGAVMAIVISLAVHTPDSVVYPFGIAMKLKWLALISFILTTLLDLSQNTGGKAAHLGGALFGLLYGLNLKKQFFAANWFGKRTKLKVAHSRKVSDDQFNYNKTAIRKRVDEILDKISRSGYDSLSREEREFLQKNHDKF